MGALPWKRFTWFCLFDKQISTAMPTNWRIIINFQVNKAFRFCQAIHRVFFVFYFRLPTQKSNNILDRNAAKEKSVFISVRGKCDFHLKVYAVSKAGSLFVSLVYLFELVRNFNFKHTQNDHSSNYQGVEFLLRTSIFHLSATLITTCFSKTHIF